MKTWNHALITGASSGLGLGLAQRLLRRGTSVSIIDLQFPQGSQSILERAAETGAGSWQFLCADVTEQDAVRTAVDQAVAQFGQPDLAVNSAGIMINKAHRDLTAEDFSRVVDINLKGSFHFASAALPHMQPGARLGLIASLAGLTSNYGFAAYGASKFGVVGLATTLRFECEPHGIGVSCICPAEVRTPMAENEDATGDPVSLELKKVAGSLDVDTACTRILAGLDAGRWLIIPSTRARLTAFANRHFPGAFYWLCNLLLRRVIRQQPARTVVG